jgi:hypothetical protein
MLKILCIILGLLPSFCFAEQHWAATIYELIGIDYKKALIAPGDRPVKIVDGGNPIREIMI